MSFIRQLNLYDFKKIKNPNNYMHFAHRHFKKNHRVLLKKILRKNLR